MKKQAMVGWSLLLFAGLIAVMQSAAAAQDVRSPDALRAEIEALKSDKVAWREIHWKTCLLDGLKESRAQNKPLILWVFIDRPSDDARC